MNPTTPYTVIDGGLSTALEAAGHDLRHQLWTARLLIENPETLIEAHLAYLHAGAEVLITSSYQTSIGGFVASGLSPDAAAAALRTTTALAREAVARHGSQALVAAAAALATLTPPPAWLAFTCRDDAHTASGDRIEDAVAAAAQITGLIAVGVNCTDPALVGSLLVRAATVTDLPLIAYANSGQIWNAATGVWEGASSATDDSALLQRWVDAGAKMIGGCCGVAPSEIARLRSWRDRWEGFSR